MSTLRKLKRSKQGGRRKYESISLHRPHHVRKMSEVLLDFARPLLKEASDEHFGVAISIAATCWNASFLSQKDCETSLDEIIEKTTDGDVLEDKKARVFLHWLINRKKVLFGNDNRIITDYEIVDEEEGHRVLVTSAPANVGKR